MGDAPAFRGYPAGAHATLVPNLFFSDVLPQIEDPAELLVTMYIFFAAGRRRTAGRWVAVEDLAADPSLRRALERLPGGADTALERGLVAAVVRRTLVRTCVAQRALVTVNGAAWRRTLPSGATEPRAPVPPATEPAPSIYALYEESIGTISPLIAEELRAAEEEYPQEWIESAFREAASMNRRSWRYVARILERWRDEGRTDASVGRVPEGKRDLAGRYRGLIQR